MSFCVLFVCTGNICRSPAAELLFRAALRPDADVSVSSAGTHGLVGHGIDRPTAAALREFGIDPDQHRTRRLDVQMITGADLILTAGGEHRSTVLHAEPLTWRRAFTLREFVRLADRAAGSRSQKGAPSVAELQSVVAEIAGRRASAAPAGSAENDIADPFGAAMGVASSTVTGISTLVDAALDALNLSTSIGRLPTESQPNP